MYLVPIIGIAIALIVLLILSGFPWPRRIYRRRINPKPEMVRVLLGLDDAALEKLFALYRQNFGAGPARYARRTYAKWKTGDVRPNEQTFNRFLVDLPKVMDFDLKCDVIRRLIEDLAPKSHHELTVFTDDWESQLRPVVETMIERQRSIALPKEIESRLRWLADDETRLAEAILKRSFEEEARINLAHLSAEMQSIGRILDETRHDPRVSHTLKFPAGTITLHIKRRR